MNRFVCSLRGPILNRQACRQALITPPTHFYRPFATKQGGDADADELAGARQWLAQLDPDTIPKNICDVSFSRSSGPGGQNVNKVSSKATLRVPTGALLSRIPRLLHRPILRSRYHAHKSNVIVIQADESRKQSENVNACFRKLHDVIVEAGRDTVPNETSPDQLKRVAALQKAEAAGRRRLKEHQSRKKSARRSTVPSSPSMDSNSTQALGRRIADQEASDSDDEHSVISGDAARSSADVRRHDQDTLGAEEEAERLLAPRTVRATSWFGRPDIADAQGEKLDGRDGKRSRRSRRAQRDRRSQEQDRQGTRREVMYAMDEAAQESKISEGGEGHDESEEDIRRLEEVQGRHKTSKRTTMCRFAAIHLVIVLGFFGLLYGAWRASHRTPRVSIGHPPDTSIAKTLSNGTHVFAPTTLLISLDGFRADFLARNITPSLNALIQAGVSPRYMMPAFPSLTFPNHFTLATGLHPESHGIVGNSFWDPVMQREFYYTDPAHSMQPEWWEAEPIWLTAELAGVPTAIHMWPGSEAHIGGVEPAYVDQFNGDERLERKIDRIFNWLDLPGPGEEGASEDRPRPQLIAAYVPDVDSDGHKYGPNSTEIRATIAEADRMIGSIAAGLEERNLTHVVNVIVVSDHGMATTSTDRTIQLEDLLDTSLIEHIDGWPLYGLRPYDTSDAHLQTLYEALLAKSQQPKYGGAFAVYRRDTDMPPVFHFSAHPRIAPLWIVPRPGWALATRDDFDVAAARASGAAYHPRGLHGYDHRHPLMRAIFVARGPAFPHRPGSALAPFQNTEVYNIVCDSLGLQPRPNNGTLRLPLAPVGLHDFEAGLHVPVDDGRPDDGQSFGMDGEHDHGEGDDDGHQKAGDKEGVPNSDWWDWFKAKFGAVTDWASQVIKGSGAESAQGEEPTQT